jgi:hypothetical protein
VVWTYPDVMHESVRAHTVALKWSRDWKKKSKRKRKAEEEDDADAGDTD